MLRVSVCVCVHVCLSARAVLMYLHDAHENVCSAHLWNALVCPVERNSIETGAQVSAFKIELIRKAAESACQSSLAFPLPDVTFILKKNVFKNSLSSLPASCQEKQWKQMRGEGEGGLLKSKNFKQGSSEVRHCICSLAQTQTSYYCRVSPNYPTAVKMTT